MVCNRFLLVLICSCVSIARADDQPQWGQAWSRNMVSEERGLPDSFDPKSGKNVKWSAELGTETHSTPIVARGRVYIGTNNGHPRDAKEEGDRGVLMCFEEQTGRFLWQIAVPKREEDIYFDWPKSGIASPVTVEGDRVYVVSNRGEVLCLEEKSKPEARSIEIGTDAYPTIVWRFNLTTEAGIWSHDAAHSSILIHGDQLYLNTGTGVDNTHKRIRTPDAPSLVVLDKHTGRLLARDNEHIAPNIFHSTWCSPSLGKANGRDLIFFAAGNGIVYAFETLSNTPSLQQSNTPLSLHAVWQFDFDPEAPKTNVHRFNSNRREGPSDFYGMPVFHNNRLYVAGGGDLWWGKTEAWLKCIDPTGTGNITTNGLIWSYPLQKHVLSTPAIHKDLVFIADCGHTVHCVDALSGKPHWTETVDGEVWASPLVADGKVYLGTRSGSFYVFAASEEKKLLSSVELHDPISGTATAANRTLYFATMNRLYAVAMKDQH
jgi:outer membrane protein assembly factor BamB